MLAEGKLARGLITYWSKGRFVLAMNLLDVSQASFKLRPVSKETPLGTHGRCSGCTATRSLDLGAAKAFHKEWLSKPKGRIRFRKQSDVRADSVCDAGGESDST